MYVCGQSVTTWTRRGERGSDESPNLVILDSRTDIGPTFINFGFFPGLIREYIKVISMVIY